MKFLLMVLVALSFMGVESAKAGGHGNQQIVLVQKQQVRRQPVRNLIQKLTSLPQRLVQNFRQGAQFRQQQRQQFRLQQNLYSQNFRQNIVSHSYAQQQFVAPVYAQQFVLQQQVNDCQQFYVAPLVQRQVIYAQPVVYSQQFVQRQEQHSCQSFFQSH